MPKKADPPMSQAEQSERFRKAVRELEADGGVSPTEAEERFDKLVRLSSTPPQRLPDNSQRN